MKEVKELEVEKGFKKNLYNSYNLIKISKDTDKEIEVNNLINEEVLEKNTIF